MTGDLLLQLVLPVMVATALAMTRITGAILVTPAFTRLGLTGIIRGGVALALTLPLTPVLAEVLQNGQPLSPALVTAILLKELVLGITIGLLFGVPIWAAELAGDLLDLQRGSTAAALLDPSAIAESSITATFFAISLLMLFFAAGGFDLMVKGLYASYRIWPVASLGPIFDPGAAELLLKLLDEIMRFALRLAAPIVIALLFTDLAMALLARTAPQLNIFELSLSAKSLVFSVLLLIYSAFMIEYMRQDISRLFDAEPFLHQLAPRRP